MEKICLVGRLKTNDVKFDLAWNHYVKNTGADDAYRTSFSFYMFKDSKNFTH